MLRRPKEKHPDTKPDHPDFAYWTNHDNGDLIAVFIDSNMFVPQYPEVLEASERIRAIFSQISVEDIRIITSEGANGKIYFRKPQNKIKIGPDHSPEKATECRNAAKAAVPHMVLISEWKHNEGFSFAFQTSIQIANSDDI